MPDLTMDDIRMDKSAFSVTSMDDEPDEKKYWLSKSPTERIQAAEIIRRILYGYDPLTARLQRFFEVVELS